MYTMNKWFYCVLITTIINVNAWAEDVQDERAAREECSAFSQAGMRECLEKKASASATELKKVEHQVSKTFGKWIHDTQYINLSRSKLEVSSKEFVRYREAHCAFNASLGGSAIGNALEIRRLACVFELNTRRADQIRDVIADLPLK